VVEVADLIVVGYIAEAGHTVDIAERKDIAVEAQQAQMVGMLGRRWISLAL